MDYIFECGNSIRYCFTSFRSILSVKETGLNSLHLTLLLAKTDLWNMALFKRNLSINFCRDLKCNDFFSKCSSQLSIKFFERKSLEELVSQLSAHVMHHHVSKPNTRKSSLCIVVILVMFAFLLQLFFYAHEFYSTAFSFDARCMRMECES